MRAAVPRAVVKHYRNMHCASLVNLGQARFVCGDEGEMYVLVDVEL